jgi:hypothetical protein
MKIKQEDSPLYKIQRHVRAGHEGVIHYYETVKSFERYWEYEIIRASTRGMSAKAYIYEGNSWFLIREYDAEQ